MSIQDYLGDGTLVISRRVLHNILGREIMNIIVVIITNKLWMMKIGVYNNMSR